MSVCFCRSGATDTLFNFSLTDVRLINDGQSFTDEEIDILMNYFSLKCTAEPGHPEMR